MNKRKNSYQKKQRPAASNFQPPTHNAVAVNPDSSGNTGVEFNGLIFFCIGIVLLYFGFLHYYLASLETKADQKIAALSKIQEEKISHLEAKIPLVVRNEAAPDGIVSNRSEVKILPVPGLPVLPSPKQSKPLESESTLEKIDVNIKSKSQKNDIEESTSGGVHVILGSHSSKEKEQPEKSNLKTIPQAKDILEPLAKDKKTKDILAPEIVVDKILEIK